MKGIIKEEFERLSSLIEYYNDKINKLPKGSLQVKEIHDNKKYVYLIYRSKRKHISQYIGQKDSHDVKALEKQIAERKKLELLRKSAKENFMEIKKMGRAFSDAFDKGFK
jgi:hypothetical protein